MERIRRFFKRFRKTLKGYTLIEVAAVVAVTGTLAAVAMPVVTDKIAAGRLAAAQNDCNAIKNAIVNFVKDTGVPPFYKIATNTLPKMILDASLYNGVLVTVDGVNPVLTGTPGGTWSLPDTSTTPTASFDAQLNNNAPKYSTLGISAWKGPYLPSVAQNIRKDPWGNKYLVSIKGLTEDDSGSNKAMRAVFVLSAGPNGIVETGFDQIVKYLEAAAGTTTPSFSLGGDDIIARIQ